MGAVLFCLFLFAVLLVIIQRADEDYRGSVFANEDPSIRVDCMSNRVVICMPEPVRTLVVEVPSAGTMTKEEFECALTRELLKAKRKRVQDDEDEEQRRR